MSQSQPIPHLLTSQQLHAILMESGTRMSLKTLWTLSTEDHKWRACVVRRTRHSTWWSRARLEEAGFLKRDDAVEQEKEPPAPVDALAALAEQQHQAIDALFAAFREVKEGLEARLSEPPHAVILRYT
jgi:hypothetical protein